MRTIHGQSADGDYVIVHAGTITVWRPDGRWFTQAMGPENLIEWDGWPNTSESLAHAIDDVRAMREHHEQFSRSGPFGTPTGPGANAHETLLDSMGPATA